MRLIVQAAGRDRPKLELFVAGFRSAGGEFGGYIRRPTDDVWEAEIMVDDEFKREGYSDGDSIPIEELQKRGEVGKYTVPQDPLLFMN